MTKAQPLVTVYLVTKNRLPLLKRAVASVVAQSYRNIELVVVNDGSSDETEGYLSRLELELAFPFRYRSFNVSRGAPAARNEAIRLAKGDYVTGLDDDDSFTSDRVEAFVQALSSGYAFYASKYIYRSDVDVCSNKPAGLISFEDLKRSNVVGNQIFAKRDSFLEVGGFDEEFEAWQDYDLWFRMSQRFGNGYRVEGATYIVDSASAGERITSSSKAYKGYRRFVEKHRGALSHKQLAYQAINDLKNRGVKIKLKELKTLIKDSYSAKRALLLYFQGHFPRFYRYLERKL